METTTLKDQLQRFQNRINAKPASVERVVVNEQSSYLCEPDCPVCHGIGYIRYDVSVHDPSFGRMYPCPNSDPFKRYGKLMGLDKEEQLFSWENIIQRENVTDAVKAVKETLVQGYGWVSLYGGYGLAKSLILKVALVEYVRATRRPGSYVRMTEIIDHLRGAFDATNPNEESQIRLDTWVNLPFLAIDEFEKVRDTEYSSERKFVLLDRRYESACRKSSVTIIASNKPPSDFEGSLSDRIMDGRFKIVQLKGVSARPMMTY